MDKEKCVKYQIFGELCSEATTKKLCEMCEDPEKYHWKMWQKEKEIVLENYGDIPKGSKKEDYNLSYDKAIEQVESFVGGTIEIKQEYLIESLAWWYIPFGWIGCSGYIVDKNDGHVNQLGSAYPLSVWFWGHIHGFKHDTYDFIITKINDQQQTLNFVNTIGFRFPHVDAKPSSSYRKKQHEEKLLSLPCIYENQRLGLSIPHFIDIDGFNLFDYILQPRYCESPGCLDVGSNKRCSGLGKSAR